ncbi:DNA polymerase III subunit gamma/tau [Fodinibius halophilus]|uniref:DNA polymerase III subunit gamma/tau n=1 Tax=Fodinibius halophilus TaxID=1736908 RepID=A0A6M1TAW4_9BACT|nr:DNA polymerase III subunit gamma/tau [Fodinibius halophilus]NGP87482.1 DNA polymerase III subunit gamma/tau [Fodinibius halophilus]
MSDNYRALTRTYRPTSFDDIVSQEHVSSTLKNAIKKNRLAHAYMFCGPRGVGKTTMARVLARTVNKIDQQVDGESLNQTLNVVEIDAASNNSVDDIRDLRERVRIPPQNGRYKIYIIDEVHMLSKSAFNALLKTLEEPPDHVIFIFATTEPHKVLPTILSRVQRFDFKRISVDQIVERLANVARDQNINIDEESLHVIAKKADGALRDALGLMDQAIAFCGNNIQHEELLRALNVVSTERMFAFMNAVETQNASEGLELINELLQEGYDIQEYLVGLTEHLRNLYVAKSSAKMHLVEASPDTKKRYKEASKTFSEDDLMRMLHIVSDAQYKIKEAHQPKIQFELTLLKLIHMERTQNLNKLLAGLKDLKKKLSNQPQLEQNDSGSEPSSEPENDPPSTNGQQNSSTPDNGGGDNPKKETVAQQPKDPDPEHSDKADGTVSESQPEPTAQEPAPSPTPVVQAESKTSPKETGNEDDEFSHLFGGSSLGNAKKSPEPAVDETEDTTEVATKTAPKRAPKDVSLNEVKEVWDSYLDDLRQHVPEMLYFQMQRVKPMQLKNGVLLLRCNDDFAKKIVDENNRRLGKFLEDKIGAYLGFESVVQKDESDAEASKSPYERFKELQERDQTIKKLVELFGAELDYNLNQ